MKPYAFLTDCIHSDGESIRNMVDDPRAYNVEYSTMLAQCEGMLEWAESVGYFRHPNQGLTLKNDWAVSYHRGFYQGQPCYWLDWSRIEHIWVKRS
jgi:hypothetical protein